MPEDLTCEDEEENPRSWLKIGGCVALAIWSCNFFAGLVFAFRGDAQPLASFADSFAIVNALFSSVAVVGAVYAVILQQRELALTRDEMRQARVAHQDSAEAQERMAAIQGYSTMLADLSKEIDYLRGRRDPIRELNLRIAEMMRVNEGAFQQGNLPGNLQQEAIDFFREAEFLGLWTAKSYHSSSVHFQTVNDLREVRKALSNELNAVVNELMKIHEEKAEASRLLRAAMISSRSAASK